MSPFNSKRKKIPRDSSRPQDVCWKVFESIKSGIYIANNDGDLVFVNQALVSLLGYHQKGELLGLNLAKELYVNPKDRQTFLNKMQEKGYVNDYEISLKKKDGSIAILSITSNYMKNTEGGISGIEGVVTDVTEKKELEKKLSFEKQKLEEILGFDEKVSSIRKFDRLYDFVVERTSKILEAERCSLILYNHDSQELCIKASKGLSEVFIGKERNMRMSRVSAFVIKTGESVFVEDIESDLRFQKRQNAGYASRSFMSVPIILDHTPIGVLNVADKNVNGIYATFTALDLKILHLLVREIAVAIENVKLYKELKFLTVTDPLTHISNFRQFTKTLHLEIKRAQRYRMPLSLIMMDIDDFKNYNNSFGHSNGDELLKNIGHLFKRCLRDTDMACRYAGDEFVAILPQTDLEGAKKAANKIKDAVGRLRLSKKVSCSIGIAKYSQGMTQHDLFLKVDQALYQAKKDGKNRICAFG
jgi:diguanylate cyclase (GGDEF)-like protein/PAS domain S-box-containing protein